MSVELTALSDEEILDRATAVAQQRGEEDSTAVYRLQGYNSVRRYAILQRATSEERGRAAHEIRGRLVELSVRYRDAETEEQKLVAARLVERLIPILTTTVLIELND